MRRVGRGRPGAPPPRAAARPLAEARARERPALRRGEACVYQGAVFAPAPGIVMHAYRSNTCAELSLSDVGREVRLSGWVHRVRDHGGVLFIDLRDHYGITQVLADSESPAFAALEGVRAEWVIRIDGTVKARAAELVNPKLPTGAIEVYVRDIEVLGAAEELPLPVFGEADYPEETRLKYRFLDLRREGLHANIMLRAPGDRAPARRDAGAGLHRVPDADPDRLLARGGARLPRAVAAASGQVLRAAAGAAAVQAADHGRGLRPLLPDRAVLPRRGPARRPLARASSTSSTWR